MPLDQVFDGGAQPGRLAERGVIESLRVLLVVEFAGPLHDNPVVPRQRCKLTIQAGHFIALVRRRQFSQVAVDVTLRSRDGIAQRRQIGAVGHHRRFDQQAGEQIGIGLHFEEPAQCIDRTVQRGSVFGLALRHQIKIRVVDSGRNCFEKILVRLADGKRQCAPLCGNLNALRDRPIEGIEPLLHGALRYRYFVALAGIECAHIFNSGLQMLGLRRDLVRDLRPLAVVLDRDQARGRSDQAIGVFGKPEQLDGCWHAAGYDVAQRRADVDGSEEGKRRADYGQGRGEAERQIQPRANRAQPGERAEPAANTARAQSQIS